MTHPPRKAAKQRKAREKGLTKLRWINHASVLIADLYQLLGFMTLPPRQLKKYGYKPTPLGELVFQMDRCHELLQRSDRWFDDDLYEEAKRYANLKKKHIPRPKRRKAGRGSK